MLYGVVGGGGILCIRSLYGRYDLIVDGLFEEYLEYVFVYIDRLVTGLGGGFSVFLGYWVIVLLLEEVFVIWFLLYMGIDIEDNFVLWDLFSCEDKVFRVVFFVGKEFNGFNWFMSLRFLYIIRGVLRRYVNININISIMVSSFIIMIIVYVVIILLGDDLVLVVG